MRKEYIKPQTEVSYMEVENMIAASAGITGTPADPNQNAGSKYREELWVEDVDLWGNESWTKVE